MSTSFSELPSYVSLESREPAALLTDSSFPIRMRRTKCLFFPLVEGLWGPLRPGSVDRRKVKVRSRKFSFECPYKCLPHARFSALSFILENSGLNMSGHLLSPTPPPQPRNFIPVGLRTSSDRDPK